MNTKELEEKLNKTVIYASTPSAEQKSACEKLQEYVYQQIPKKLYRFRRCDENSLNAFLNDQLWFATASKMNDDYDSMLFYSKDVVEKEISSLFDEHGNIRLFAGLQNEIPSAVNIVKSIVGDEQLPSYIAGFKQLTNEQVKEKSNEVRIWIEQSRVNLESEIVSRLQKITKFACFSERIDSPLMWGHYADSSKGFALEYDFSNGETTDCPHCLKLGKTCFAPINGMILPVIYSNKRYDATEAYSYILRSFLLDFLLMKIFGGIDINLKQKMLGPIDSLIWTKIIIHKAKDWEKEKEWRIIYTNSFDATFSQKECAYVIKKPTGIYLGRRISPANQKFLIDVANEKGYKIYKENVTPQNRNFKMVATQLNNKKRY